MNTTSSEMTVFAFESSALRTIHRDGEPWFVAKDVCSILEINNPRQALTRLEADEKNTVILNDGIRGNPNTNVINESGLYALILSSRKAEARKFRKWVTSEVLPAIRKHGHYTTDPTWQHIDALIARGSTPEKAYLAVHTAQQRLGQLTREKPEPKAKTPTGAPDPDLTTLLHHITQGFSPDQNTHILTLQELTQVARQHHLFPTIFHSATDTPQSMTTWGKYCQKHLHNTTLHTPKGIWTIHRIIGKYKSTYAFHQSAA